MQRRVHSLVLVLLIVGLALTGGVAWAGAKIFDFGPDTCTSLNCNSVTINGTYDFGPFNNADPFVIQVFTAGNECVRIDVTSEGADLEATLTCPDGKTWKDDDRVGSLLPLIQAFTTSGVRGWCTLTISKFNGVGPYADFTFRYGRYNRFNPGNCPAEFPAPIASFSPERAKPEGNVAGPERSGGTSD